MNTLFTAVLHVCEFFLSPRIALRATNFHASFTQVMDGLSTCAVEEVRNLPLVFEFRLAAWSYFSRQKSVSVVTASLCPAHRSAQR